MEELEGLLETNEKELRHMTQSQDSLQRNFVELNEMMQVLTKDSAFFEEGDTPSTSQAASSDISSTEDLSAKSLLDEAPSESRRSAIDAAGGHQVRFVTGVVQRSKLATFQLVLWRALHGNLYLRSADIEEKLLEISTGEKVEVCFPLFLQIPNSLLLLPSKKQYRKQCSLSSIMVSNHC